MTMTEAPEQHAAGLREQILQRIEGLDLEQLAKATAHEYDDEVRVPDTGTAGAAFLESCRAGYLGWVRAEHRFPLDSDDVDDALGRWQDAVATATEVAQAVVDLALFYSHHASIASGISPTDFRLVLGVAAEQFVVTLTEEYGPLG